MKIASLPIFAAILSVSCLVLGTATASADCFTAGAPADAKECQRVFLTLADHSLNETYSALTKTNNAGENRDLRAEQRAWLKERDRTCRLTPDKTSGPDWTTAILADTARADCVIQETLGRNDMLAFVLGQHGGKPLPFPHSADGEMYTASLKPDDRLNDYLDRLHQGYDRWDGNKDGVLSAADAPTARSQDYFRAYWGEQARADHPLTWEAVAEKGTVYFRFMDDNCDDIVSIHEINLVKELQISLELGGYQENGGAKCVLPKPTPDAEILLLSAYEAAALASVGMHDTEIRAGLINILPGSRPLYVVLATERPVIWTFEGDVRRVQRVVLSSSTTGPNTSDPKEGPPLAGATGLKPSQIFFEPDASCMRFFDKHPSRDSILRIRSLRRELGRLPDVISTDYKVSGFSVPDGGILKPDEKSNAMAWQNLRSQIGLFYPGGVVPIDPEQVVSSQKVQIYDVLPGVAGLRQLVERGALLPLEGRAIYRVTRKITLPAGLYGASLAKFIVPAGVPVPEGDPGHSCIVSEDGKVLAGFCGH